MRSRVLGIAVAAAAALAPPSAHAFDELPMHLPAPGAGVRAATFDEDPASQPATWLVGARRGPASERVAGRFGARRLGIGSAYVVGTAKARAFAGALRRAGRLTYAEPDVRVHSTSALDVLPAAGPRTAVVDAGLVPPPPNPAATLAVVDQLADVSVADLQPTTRQLNPGPIVGPHGTMVASVAAGALNGGGVFGIYPGAPVLSVGLPLEISCSTAANGIVAAARAKARVINLSFGTVGNCATMFAAVQVAYAAGSLVVAATGNEFAEGNPVIYPAAYPHVLSVASLDASLAPSAFSSTNAAVDMAAPGAGVPVAVPPAFDTDGVVDGITLASGTSFSAPIVAGAATWLATARPSLTNGQLADVLRRSARDVGPAGYDRSTGFGLVRMAGALSHPTPRADVLEPNDGITFVNGGVFGKTDRFVWTGSGRRRLDGSADRVEDPVDVYRIRVPRRARFGIRVRPRFGDPDLYVFSGGAQSLSESDRIIARSTRRTGSVDSVTITNRAARSRSLYVVVDVETDSDGALNTDYRLEFQRLKRR